jgi:hypothetical protein
MEDKKERETLAAQNAYGSKLSEELGSFGGGGAQSQSGSMSPVTQAMMPPEQVKAIIDANVPEADRPFAYRMAEKESAFNPSAVSPTGAKGLFQFTGGTWGDVTGQSVGRGADGRTDPVANTKAFVELTRRNREALRGVLGRDPTPGELAVAHQQGVGGATALLTGKGTVNPRNLAVQAGNPKNAQDIMRYYGYAPGEGQGGRVQVTQAGGSGDATLAGGDTLQGRGMPDANRLMQIATDRNAPPEIRERAKLMLQSMPKPRDPLDDRARALQIQKAERDLQRPDISGVEIMRDPTTGEIVRVDKATGQASVVRQGQASNKAPETRVVKQPDGSEVALQWDTGSKKWLPMDAPQGGNPVAAPLKLTEAQSKDQAFLTRSNKLIPRLEKQDEALLDGLSATGGRIPLVGNYLKTPEYRNAEQTARELLAVILRKDTGAAVTDQEMSQYSWIYLPQPGDDKETIIQKREGRRTAIDGLRRGLGGLDIILDQRDALLERQSAAKPAPGAPVPAPTAKGAPKGPPAGVSPAEWKAMTDEERALWK